MQCFTPCRGLLASAEGCMHWDIAWHCLSLVQVNQLTEGPLFVRVHDETTLQEVQADIAAQIGECCGRRSRGSVVPRRAHTKQAVLHSSWLHPRLHDSFSRLRCSTRLQASTPASSA